MHDLLLVGYHEGEVLEVCIVVRGPLSNFLVLALQQELRLCRCSRNRTKWTRTFPKNSGEAESELGEIFGLL